MLGEVIKGPLLLLYLEGQGQTPQPDLGSGPAVAHLCRPAASHLQPLSCSATCLHWSSLVCAHILPSCQNALLGSLLDHPPIPASQYCEAITDLQTGLGLLPAPKVCPSPSQPRLEDAYILLWARGPEGRISRPGPCPGSGTEQAFRKGGLNEQNCVRIKPATLEMHPKTSSPHFTAKDYIKGSGGKPGGIGSSTGIQT